MLFNDALNIQVKYVVSYAQRELNSFFAGHPNPTEQEQAVGSLFFDILEGALYRMLEGGNWVNPGQDLSRGLKPLIKYVPGAGWTKI